MKYVFCCLLLIPFTILNAQSVDKIIGIVGNQPILYSDIAFRKEQAVLQGQIISDCELLKEVFTDKLILYWALEDSVKVTEADIEQELDKKIRFFAQQFGSMDKLEEQFGKSIKVIKDDYRGAIRDQTLTNIMKSNIVANATITPKEVKEFFNTIDKDSIPSIASEIEIAMLLKTPEPTKEQSDYVKEKLNTYRDRVINDNEDFRTLAILYSDDKGSAEKGGELGFLGRGSLVPEFEAAAYALKDSGDLSTVIKSEYGYHIVQLIARRGDLINVRHILIVPKASNLELQKTTNFLDSVRTLIEQGTYTFEQAVLKFSDDKETRQNGGLINNYYTASTRFEADQVDPTLAPYIVDLSVGEVSKPIPNYKAVTLNGFRLIKIVSQTKPHEASLKTDYYYLQNMAQQNKQGDILKNWVTKYKKKTYIQFNEPYNTCKTL